MMHLPEVYNKLNTANSMYPTFCPKLAGIGCSFACNPNELSVYMMDG